MTTFHFGLTDASLQDLQVKTNPVVSRRSAGEFTFVMKVHDPFIAPEGGSVYFNLSNNNDGEDSV